MSAVEEQDDDFVLNVEYWADDAVTFKTVALGEDFPAITIIPHADEDGRVEVNLSVGGGISSAQVVALLFGIGLTLDLEAATTFMEESLLEAGLTLSERKE